MKYEIDGLRLARSTSATASGPRSFEALVGRAHLGCLAAPDRPLRRDAMALFDGRSLKRLPDNGVSSNGLSNPLSTRERRN